MNDNRQVGGPFGPLMAPWLQAMRLWSNAAMQFVPPGMGTDWMQQFSQLVPGAYPATGMASRGTVSVCVTSTRPTEVALHLEPAAEGFRLRADPLASVVPGVAALDKVEFEYGVGRARVTVTVPEAQPAGTYFGLIRDEAGARRGELRVQVMPTGAPS